MIVAPQMVQRDIDFLLYETFKAQDMKVRECYSDLGPGIFDAAIIDLTVAEMSDADTRASGLLLMQVVTRRTEF